MSKKPPIRWDWIEEHWQRGTLSNYQIAELHEKEFGRRVDESSIRLHASQHGWQRDISEAIRRETRAKLAKGEIRKTPHETPRSTGADSAKTIQEQEIDLVDRASDALVVIEYKHRRQILDSAVLADRMQAYAMAALPVDEDGIPRLQYEPGELKDIISTASNAVSTRARVITLERKVFGMDDPKKDGDTGAATRPDPVTILLPDNGRTRLKAVAVEVK